ncbi:Isoquinoline 1-oxidoreductase subunit [Oceanibaculum pacificum]|uniref:Isoquinoline 1-oxidoreductase subunit n=1 Tax=Oceanibaculum pacificum TaxID=580166 RepID=UPI000A88F33E|nr:Isoquinoline 1-oxidoreductase subunit [Oceanibaculum pacificum]
MRKLILLAAGAALIAGVAGATLSGQGQTRAQTGSAAAALQNSELRPASAFAGIADPRQRSVALFEESGKVLQHPRCVNCHPVGDRPRQGDMMQLHQPLVVRGADGHGAPGMKCSTCHGAANFDPPGIGAGVPGDPHWHLAPASMAWEGKSLGQICQQIKDPARNGGKDMAALIKHMAEDSLVGWAWNPGKGRTPAPGTQDSFAELIEAWAANGAHCPAS